MAEADDFTSCGVCGRTILRGERIADYSTPDGERIGVCALCKPAAEDAGWLPAELAEGVVTGQASRRRGIGLRKRLSRASEAARGIARSGRPRSEGGEAGAEGRRTDRAGTESRRQRSRGTRRAGAESRRQAPPSPEPRRDREPAAEDRRPGRDAEGGEVEPPRSSPAGGEAASAPPRPERPPSPERVLRSAIELFNSSGERRKVAGLIRSLGEPSVAVRPGSGGGAVITVAWELSWYQWEIGSGGGEPVREAAKGSELAELAERDRAWNAGVEADGAVSLDRPAARRAGEETG